MPDDGRFESDDWYSQPDMTCGSDTMIRFFRWLEF
jgi:hypothetical protein